MFKLKRFSINQDSTSFKVGTDSILLGSWTDPGPALSILDIGTGTGILALMMAQKTEHQTTRIQAIELEPQAALEAAVNFRNSPWKDRLEVSHSSIQLYAESASGTFDCLICNPPYYESAFLPTEPAKALARNTQTLGFHELAQLSRILLNEEGALNLILPFPESLQFKSHAESEGLQLSRLTRVFSKPSKKTEIRHLMKWLKPGRERSRIEPVEDTLILETEIHHVATEEFKSLTRDFYLQF